jgi:hypothetical protein
MNPLARLDLRKFRVDSESFAGQALDLGVKFRKLDKDVADGLLVFLRLKGTELGRKNRTGIGITNDLLTRAVRQVLACIDLGLLDLSGGDLNMAVDLLKSGDYEEFRKKGYECAFNRLQEMKDTCESIAARPESAFLPDEQRRIGAWASLAPESWLCPDLEDEGKERVVDPVKDFDAFRELKSRMDFLRTVPWKVLDQLKEGVGDEGSFSGLVRNLILSLAVDKADLVHRSEDIESFHRTCFTDGGLRENIRKKVLSLVKQQLSAEVEEEFRTPILEEFRAEICNLERMGFAEFAESFLMEKKMEASEESSDADKLLELTEVLNVEE